MAETITPMFLTEQLATEVARAVHHMVTSSELLKPLLTRHGFHIVVLVPAKEVSGKFPSQTKPFILFDGSFRKDLWGKDAHYNEIARSKAQQLWDQRSNGGLCISPHLLFKGETRWTGGVECEGIIVTCSGVQGYFDRMIASMVANIIIALAHHAYKNNPGIKADKDFLE